MKCSNDLKFSCSLIMFDVVITDGILEGLNDNVITFSTNHQLPQNAQCLALISFGADEFSSITVELSGEINKHGLDTFKITIPKTQAGWPHFNNLLNYV